MLNIEAPFPQLYSKGLLIDGCKAEPARITQLLGGKGRNQEVQVSLTSREGATGTRRVKLAELIDASPLSDIEAAELEKLERDMVGKPVSERSQRYKRYLRLTLRAGHAEQLAKAEAAAAAAERRSRFYQGMPERRRG